MPRTRSFKNFYNEKLEEILKKMNKTKNELYQEKKVIKEKIELL